MDFKKIKQDIIMKELLENLLHLNEDEFEDIFQPFDKKEFLKKRLADAHLIENDDGTYSTDGNIDLSYLGLEELLIRFKYVGGNFWCQGNKLTSLEGCPEEVGEHFNCYGNNLTTLEGAPTIIGGSFSCPNNRLTTLEGAPESVGGYFDCNSNELISLKGAPERLGGSFYCFDNKLSSRVLKQTIKRDYL